MDESTHAASGEERDLKDASTPDSDRHQLDGEAVRRMFEHAAGWLEQHVGAVNALNVFPVPDGDTGTKIGRAHV